MKTEKWTCDIDGCNNPAKHKEFGLQVIFTTDQTEGRSCDPYLSHVVIDLCHGCMTNILKYGKYIFAHGAMGHNTYYFRKGNDQPKDN